MATGQVEEALLKSEKQVPPNRCCLLFTFVKFACAYVDVWFLRDTFGHDDRLKERLKEEVDMINEAFDVDHADWKEPTIVWASFGVYLRYVLGPSVTAFDQYPGLMINIGMLILGVLMMSALLGLKNLSAVPKDLGAFQKVEHLPIVPFVLLLCTHIIMMIFAHRQLCVLKSTDKCHLPFPLTYTTFVGKFFMVVRMIMAYSSGEMGTAIDYFTWQELILTSMHCVFSLLIGDPSPSRQNGEYKDVSEVKNYSNQLKLVFLKVFAIDSIKTVAMYFYWVSFQPGWIANLFDRIPYVGSQISLSILIHAILDMLQTAATMFTMFIGRFGRRLINDRG